VCPSRRSHAGARVRCVARASRHAAAAQLRVAVLWGAAWFGAESDDDGDGDDDADGEREGREARALENAR
jgi:hypothetical protein